MLLLFFMRTKCKQLNSIDVRKAVVYIYIQFIGKFSIEEIFITNFYYKSQIKPYT